MAAFGLPNGLTGVRPPASPAAVAAAGDALGDVPHPRLLDVYAHTDGFYADGGVTVYEALSLAERNDTFEVGVYAPGYLLIGDDSGGRGFLLAVDVPESPVYVSDLGDLHPPGFEVAGTSMAAWLDVLAGGAAG
jgi:hypothetical protein